MTLSLSFILFYVQSIASSIGFEWPEELAMVLSVMLSHFRNFPVFIPCPCEVLCSYTPWYISCAPVQFTDKIFFIFWPIYLDWTFQNCSDLCCISDLNFLYVFLYFLQTVWNQCSSTNEIILIWGYQMSVNIHSWLWKSTLWLPIRASPFSFFFPHPLCFLTNVLNWFL